MNKTTGLLAIIALTTSLSSHAFLSLKSDDSAKTAASISSLTGALDGQVSSQVDSPIVDALTSKLNVSPQQATGGAGALLALASNSLSSSESSELGQLIPSMGSLQSSVPGLMQLATSNSAVTDVFSTLGLDPSMVAQFAPIILQYLTSQNASSGLLGSLTSLWG